jgi:hypothetical protein
MQVASDIVVPPESTVDLAQSACFPKNQNGTVVAAACGSSSYSSPQVRGYEADPRAIFVPV